MNLEHFLATLPYLFWVCLIVPVAFALMGSLLARKWIKPINRNQHHDIAHAILGPAGTIFSILGAFIVATTWHEYAETRTNLNEESDALRSLYVNAEVFAPAMCSQVQSLCRLYRDTVLEHEWQIVHKGTDNVLGDEIATKLSKLYMNYSIRNEKEKIYFEQSIQKFDKMTKFREQRIEDSCTGLLPLLWILFLLAGIVLITVSFLMISSPGKTHGAMVVLIAMMFGIMVFAIISLDYPFTGFTRINTTPFTLIPMK